MSIEMRFFWDPWWLDPLTELLWLVGTSVLLWLAYVAVRWSLVLADVVDHAGSSEGGDQA